MGAFNGAGTFVRSYNWANDAANAIPIMASRMDTEDSGFATGLSNCICKDGQTTITADIPLANHKLTGVADATATQDAMNQRTADARYDPISIKGIKSADLPRSSVIILADDPDLIIPLAAATKYAIDIYLPISTNTGAAAGYAMGLAYTGTAATVSLHGISQINGSFSGNGVWSAIISSSFSVPTLSGSNVIDCIHRKGSIITTTSGNLSVQWAQNSSSGFTTITKAGAYIRAVKLA